MSSDTFRITSAQFYNVRVPVNANGQDVNLNNLQMIARYTDPVTKEDLLEFMQKYMLPSRWDDADLPIKVFIDNNVPSPEYREAVRQGLLSWDVAANAWLPEGRKLVLSQIVSSDPGVGIRVDYTAINRDPEFSFVSSDKIFKKGVIEMNPAQGTNGAVKTAAHEIGHGIFGQNPAPLNHSPYMNHNMYFQKLVLPSPFEGLLVATKYKLKKDTVERYSR